MKKPIVLKGLEFNFDLKVAEKARKESRLLLLDIDFSELCDLNCRYCDRYDDRKIEDKTKLSYEETIELFQQAHSLGCKTVEIPGVGEPMLDPNFWKYLEAIHSLGMTTVIYTSAYGRKGALITEDSARYMKDLGVSVILKCESMIHSVQDSLVGCKGYSEVMERVLFILIKVGFNVPDVTHLGIHTVITNDNRNGVIDIFRFCRRNNIFPYVVSSIPDGNALRMGTVIMRDEAEKVLNEIKRIDLRENNVAYESVLPVAGGFYCRQIDIGMFVNLYGDIYECNGGGRYFGNIRDFGGLSSAWHSEPLKSLREKPQNGYCPVREKHWRSCAV